MVIMILLQRAGMISMTLINGDRHDTVTSHSVRPDFVQCPGAIGMTPANGDRRIIRQKRNDRHKFVKAHL